MTYYLGMEYNFEAHLNLLKKKSKTRLSKIETYILIEWTIKTKRSLSIENTYLESLFYQTYLDLLEEYLYQDMSHLEFCRAYQMASAGIDDILDDYEKDGIGFRNQPSIFFGLTDEINNLTIEFLEIEKRDQKSSFYEQIKKLYFQILEEL